MVLTTIGAGILGTGGVYGGALAGGGLAAKSIHDEKRNRRLLKMSPAEREQKLIDLYPDPSKRAKFKYKLAKFEQTERKHAAQGSTKRGSIRAGKLIAGLGTGAAGLGTLSAGIGLAGAGAAAAPLVLGAGGLAAGAGAGYAGYHGVKGGYYAGKKLRKKWKARKARKYASLGVDQPSRRKRRRSRKRKSRRRPSRKRKSRKRKSRRRRPSRKRKSRKRKSRR